MTGCILSAGRGWLNFCCCCRCCCGESKSQRIEKDESAGKKIQSGNAGGGGERRRRRRRRRRRIQRWQLTFPSRKLLTACGETMAVNYRINVWWNPKQWRPQRWRCRAVALSGGGRHRSLSSASIGRHGHDRLLRTHHHYSFLVNIGINVVLTQADGSRSSRCLCVYANEPC